MIEVHHNPKDALVDSSQMITPQDLEKIIKACNNIHNLVEHHDDKD